MKVVVYIPAGDQESRWMRDAVKFIEQQHLTMAGYVVDRGGTGWASATAMVAAGEADKVLVITREHVPTDVLLVVDEYMRPARPERRTRLIRSDAVEQPWPGTYAAGTEPQVPRAYRRTGRVER